MTEQKVTNSIIFGVGIKNFRIENKLYLPVLSAQRHLIKPVDRYGKEQRNKKKLKGNWFKIFE